MGATGRRGRPLTGCPGICVTALPIELNGGREGAALGAFLPKHLARTLAHPGVVLVDNFKRFLAPDRRRVLPVLRIRWIDKPNVLGRGRQGQKGERESGNGYFHAAQ